MIYLTIMVLDHVSKVYAWYQIDTMIYEMVTIVFTLSYGFMMKTYENIYNNKRNW